MIELGSVGAHDAFFAHKWSYVILIDDINYNYLYYNINYCFS